MKENILVIIMKVTVIAVAQLQWREASRMDSGLTNLGRELPPNISIKPINFELI